MAGAIRVPRRVPLRHTLYWPTSVHAPGPANAGHREAEIRLRPSRPHNSGVFACQRASARQIVACHVISALVNLRACSISLTDSALWSRLYQPLTHVPIPCCRRRQDRRSRCRQGFSRFLATRSNSMAILSTKNIEYRALCQRTLGATLGKRRQSAYWLNAFALGAVAASAALVAIANTDTGKSNQILNVSYDPTREVFQDLNQRFTARYLKETGRKWSIQQSHGSSSRQARAVIDGLKADVMTLALFPDVDSLRKRGLIPDGWRASVCRTNRGRLRPPSFSWCGRAIRRTSTTGRIWPAAMFRSSPRVRRLRATGS